MVNSCQKNKGQRYEKQDNQCYQIGEQNRHHKQNGNKKKLDSRIEIMNYGRYFPEFEAFKDAHDRSLKHSNKILVAS